MSEPREIRLKRLKMRSMRRGIREMDLILSDYADRRLADLDPAGLDLYERLLDESDQDLYAWVSGQAEPRAEFADLIRAISRSYLK